MGSSGGGSGGSSGGEQYCLRWNNHQSNLLGVFSQLLRDESLVDVTLACSEGLSIRAHKVVLSACSSYFQALFLDHPSRHPIVILKDVRFAELRTLIEFMYKGEVNVEYCQLSALLKTAESLKVKGLAEMTREYKPSPEQLEPKELVTRRSHNQSRPLTPEEQLPDKPQHSPTPLQNWRICKSPTDNKDRDKDVEKEKEDNIKQRLPSSPDVAAKSPSVAASGECANHLAAAACSALGQPAIYSSRLSSPLDCQSLAGPSNLPPVQQVPLSLKKEADWGGGGEGGGGDDIKPPRESPTDYSRNAHHDSEQLSEAVSREEAASPRLYPCMYCGNTFPHQSKLTRHILSHSLETLKYRERHQAAPPIQSALALAVEPPMGYLDFGGRPPHDPPDPTDQPPTTTPMELELAEAVGGGASGVVLCKFCGKSFPDVSSLIAHLPVHTGDRPFKCEFCGKAFKLRHHMKDHCRVHTGERPFRCALCGKTFSRSTILKAHEKTHYPKYVRKFLSPSPLDAEEDNPHSVMEVDLHHPLHHHHSQQHHPAHGCLGSPVPDRPSSTQSSRSSTPFALPPFPALPTALLEVGLIHPSLLGDDVFRCSSCLAAFPSLWLLEQHAALQHVGGGGGGGGGGGAVSSGLDKPFVCEQCGQSYRYRSAYVKHREQNHRARLPADKLFSCDVCGMQFRYLKSFKKHRLNHALERLHEKNGGDGGGGASSEVSRSMMAGAARRERELERDVLQENSSDQVSSSNETINVEEDHRQLDDDEATAAAVEPKKEDMMADDMAAEGTSSDAERTEEADQDDTIDSLAFSFPAGCPQAGLATSAGGGGDSSVLGLLRGDAGGGDAPDRQRERRFACPFCGKCVRSKENLKLHVRKHTGERPFVCLFCGRAFGGKSDLTRHLRIHTGERPYHCDMCGKCFARADYLSKHLTTHINTPR